MTYRLYSNYIHIAKFVLHYSAQLKDACNMDTTNFN